LKPGFIPSRRADLARVRGGFNNTVMNMNHSWYASGDAGPGSGEVESVFR